MDPAEVRRRNLLPRFTEPHATPVGTVYDVGDYPAALEGALAAAGYDDLRREQAGRRAAGDPVALGIGMANYVEITVHSTYRSQVVGDQSFSELAIDEIQVIGRPYTAPAG